jgi:hypothetical protein
LAASDETDQVSAAWPLCHHHATNQLDQQRQLRWNTCSTSPWKPLLSQEIFDEPPTEKRKVVGRTGYGDDTRFWRLELKKGARAKVWPSLCWVR